SSWAPGSSPRRPSWTASSRSARSTRPGSGPRSTRSRGCRRSSGACTCGRTSRCGNCSARSRSRGTIGSGAMRRVMTAPAPRTAATARAHVGSGVVGCAGVWPVVEPRPVASGALYRVAAFTTVPTGGNPAGVWVGDVLPDPATMQRIAAEVGYSETAFVAPAVGVRRTVRYYSPAGEVSFCGHATIAAGVVLGEADGDGTYRFETRAGVVPVTVRAGDGHREASLTSVVPTHAPVSDSLVDEALALLRWARRDLDASIPPARAYAGAWH